MEIQQRVRYNGNTMKDGWDCTSLITHGIYFNTFHNCFIRNTDAKRAFCVIMDIVSITQLFAQEIWLVMLSNITDNGMVELNGPRCRAINDFYIHVEWNKNNNATTPSTNLSMWLIPPSVKCSKHQTEFHPRGHYRDWYTGSPFLSHVITIHLKNGCPILNWVAEYDSVIENTQIHTHYDIIKLEPFPRYWPLRREFSHEGQCRGALISSLIRAWTDGSENKLDAGYSRRHRIYYDVPVMTFFYTD